MSLAKNGKGWMLLTGGAGFIGTNLAKRLLSEGKRVMVFDNLSRPGVIQNLDWLRGYAPRGLEVQTGDVRDPQAVRAAIENAEAVFHLAAQVAVTSSILDPCFDFEVNARGTLNVLEAVRRSRHKPPVIYTSTNKVYGELEDIELKERESRYVPASLRVARRGIDETRPLDLRTPYGCSKGSGEYYVLEYARTYGLHAVALRMSCIYGPHQMGNEDQGWIAHFFRRALGDEAVTIYGDGKQVRDVLYVDDLIDALLEAYVHARRLGGSVFNLGGGPEHTLSLRELVDAIGEIRGEPLSTSYSDWRRGDQRYFVSCIEAFERACGWKPKVGVPEGLRRLNDWMVSAQVSNPGGSMEAEGVSK